MKLLPGVFVTQREHYSWNVHSDEIVQTHNDISVQVRYPGKKKLGKLTSLSGDRSAQPEQQEQEGHGRIGFFRTKVWAAKIVERWEPDYGEVDPEERDRKGGHLWWWQAPTDTDDEVASS